MSISRENKACARKLVDNGVKEAPDMNLDDEEISPTIGRNLLTSLFKSSRDKLWIREDHIINFVTFNHVLTTPVGRESIDHSIIRLYDMNKEKIEVGQIISLRHGGISFQFFRKRKS